MQNRTRRELRKLRELVWHYLDGETCSLCKKPLVTMPDDITFGDATAPPMLAELSIHHPDNDHYENKHESKKKREVVHRSCHRRHHVHDGKDY